MVLCFAPSSLASFDFGAFDAHAAAVTERKRERLVGGRGRKRVRLHTLRALALENANVKSKVNLEF